MSKAERSEETEGKKRPSAGIKHAGSLIQDGYRVEEGQDRRRTALNKAVHHYGYAETVEKVNALAVMNKNHKENHRRLEDDLEYLKAQFKDK